MENKEKRIKKTNNEMMKEIEEDIAKLGFGQVVIYVQNGYPYRKEVRISKTFKKKKKYDEDKKMSDL